MAIFSYFLFFLSGKMAIAKKILLNFNTDPFLTSKLISEGSYDFALFVQ